MPPAEPRSPFVTVPETSATEVTGPEPDQVRIGEQERVRVQLQAWQMEQLPKTLAVYVEDGLVSAEAEAQHRQLAEIDRDLRNHDIDADEAEAQRVEILDEAGRLALESDLRSVVAGVVSSLQIFDALQKIRSQYDGLLRMLIQYKELVVGGDNGDRTRLVTELMGSPRFLDIAVAAMERRDPELHQVAERQQPYDLAAPGQLKSSTNLTIEPSFVDDLRRLSTSEYTDKMHSRDRTERARATASCICSIS